MCTVLFWKHGVRRPCFSISSGDQREADLKYRNSLGEYFKSSDITSRSESWYSTGTRNEIERKKWKWETLIEKESVELGKRLGGLPRWLSGKVPTCQCRRGDAGSTLGSGRTHSSILAWKICRQRSLAGYSPWGCRSPTGLRD